MRKDVALKHRLAQVAALQTFNATASRADLATAQAARSEAETALAMSHAAFDAGVRRMDALLANEALDFDGWRIGRAMFDELAAKHDEAAMNLSHRENTVLDAHRAFETERARESQAKARHRRLARHLAQKRDEAETIEANAVAASRKRRGNR